MGAGDDGEIDDQSVQVPEWDPDDEEPEERPMSFRDSISEVAAGLAALLLVSVGVLVLYIVGGVFLGFVAWAAPAVLAVTAALILARYLSRRR